MRLTNNTVYDTRVLHQLTTAVHAWMAEEIGHRARTWPRLVCEVAYARNADGACTGWAYKGGSLMRIRLPKPGRRRLAKATARMTSDAASTQINHREPVLTVRAASVIWHELMHIFGFDHNRIAKHPDAMFGWAATRFGERLPVRPATPRSVVGAAERFARVLAAEQRWTTRLKRAQTALKKLRRQRRYYERQGTRPASRERRPRTAAATVVIEVSGQ